MRRPSPLLAALGRRLRALREGLGLTQEQVGERAGFSGKYISEVERGLRDVPLSTLRAITHDALGASLEHVFAGLEPSGRLVARESGEPYLPYPRNVEELARVLAELPPARRRKVVAALRAVLALTGE